MVLMTTNCHAEKHYIYIDKVGIVEKGRELGQTAKWDVVGIYPFTKQYKPTLTELGRYHVIVADITDKEYFELLAVKKDGSGNEVWARERKIDYENLSNVNQEAEITKTELNEKIIIKPNISVTP